MPAMKGYLREKPTSQREIQELFMYRLKPNREKKRKKKLPTKVESFAVLKKLKTEVFNPIIRT